MSYGTVANIRALTGKTTTQISDADVAILIAIADNQIDNEPGVSLNTAQKALASDFLTSVFALENINGNLAINNLMQIGGTGGAIKLDVKTAALITDNQAKRYFEKYQEILTQAPSTDLITKAG